MGDVTRILAAIDRGDPAAADQLLPLVYDELRRLAARHLGREPAGQTLQPTAMVHEAYLRLVGNDGSRWEGRHHFYIAAARAMRNILVDRARLKGAAKRGEAGGGSPWRNSTASRSRRRTSWTSTRPSPGSPGRTRPRRGWSSSASSPA